MNFTQDVSNKLGGLRDGLRGLRLSVVELIFLLGAVGFALFVGYFYFNSVQPLQAQLDEMDARELAARTAIKGAGDRANQLTLQHQNSERILNSLYNFEGRLKSDNTGKAAIIDEIEMLAKTHKVGTGGISFRPIEADPLLDEKGNPVQQVVRNDRQLNVYPALGIDTTIVGDYPDLRRFLANLERSRQFLIINALVFQGEAEKVRRAAARLAAAGEPGQQPAPGGQEVTPVSLKIEMDTYFKQPN